MEALVSPAPLASYSSSGFRTTNRIVARAANLMKLPHIRSSLFLIAMLCANTVSANVVSSLGAFDGWVVLYSGQAFGVGWTQTQAYEDVSVSARLTGFGRSTETGRAFLTSNLGLGTTSSSEIGFTTLTFPETEEYVTLFTGLSLPAGSYYLSLVGDSPSWGSGWTVSLPPTLAASDGSALTGAFGFFNPSTSFLPSSAVYDGGSIPNFFVSGTSTASVPEGGSLTIVFAGACLLLWAARPAPRNAA